MLHDRQPSIRHFKVPELSERTSEKVRIEAAATYSENQMSDRIVEFLKGPRPEEYSVDIPEKLIERIDFTDKEWVFRFWGRQTVKVPRVAGDNKEIGRKLKRSGKPADSKNAITLKGDHDE